MSDRVGVCRDLWVRFNACITPGNGTTVHASGYELEVASNTGPGWSTHAETLAEAQGDFADYLRADPDDVDESDDTSNSTANHQMIEETN